jgi:hypothetical protein
MNLNELRNHQPTQDSKRKTSMSTALRITLALTIVLGLLLAFLVGNLSSIELFRKDEVVTTFLTLGCILFSFLIGFGLVSFVSNRSSHQ